MSKEFICETSARHMHVSQEHLEILFGKGFELSNRFDLSQPGQFATNERVDVVGPKSTQKGVSILGPVRAATQVELSMTDARSLGIDAPVRESGDIKGSPGCKLVGPKGEVEIDSGVIVAKRHIHMTPEDAKRLGVKDQQIVNVEVNGSRPVIFKDAVVRVNENFSLAMHIDTDESNAAGCAREQMCKIID